MDAITSYIDHMFHTLPQTHEVRRAKSELLQMSEDRYHELRSEGVSENEAVGRVITQFGNLDELADDLGIRSEFDGVGDPAIALSAADAEGYLRTSSRASTLIGGGVFLILLGLTIQLLMGSSPLGIGLFLVFVAAAVGGFIAAGMLMNHYSDFENRMLHLDGVTLSHYQRQRVAENPRFMAHIIGGVVIIILGVAIEALTGAFRGDIGAVVPLAAGIGVFLLVRGGMRRGALDRLTSQGEYSPRRRAEEDNSLVSRWAGPYWLLAVVIYVAWSFIANAWHISWIVWPIAGVTFALFAAVSSAIESGARR